MKKNILIAFLICLSLNVFASDQAERVNGGGTVGGGGFSPSNGGGSGGGGGFTVKINQEGNSAAYWISNEGVSINSD